MKGFADTFRAQRSVRRPCRRYVDQLAEYRPTLHTYCCRLTGNVWDGEGLVQDTRVRVFSLLGKSDVTLENPKSYLIRVASNLWIDRVRPMTREYAAMVLEQAESSATPPNQKEDANAGVRALFQMLHPQERAALTTGRWPGWTRRRESWSSALPGR